MSGDSTKGFFFGCVTSVLVLMLFSLLLVFLCGMLMRGCFGEALSDDSTESISDTIRKRTGKPESDGDFTKSWTLGDGNDRDPKILRISLKGVLMDDDRLRLLGFDDASSAPSALRQIKAATKDRSLRGIWLDINSPGGSVTTSDVLYDALLRFKAAETNRFVFVHMGDMCCSGGYYISAAADRIMARPTSLTGSIGVIMNGFNAATLAQKIGVESVTIASAANKDLLNPLKPVDPKHLEILKKPISQMYDRFVSIVAKGRHMPEAKVRQLADGRIFSADDAKSCGLVDAIGHEQEALKEACGLSGAKRVRVYRYREKPNLEKLLLSSFLFESPYGLMRELKAALLDDAVPPTTFWRREWR